MENPHEISIPAFSLYHVLGYTRSGSCLEIKAYQEAGTDNIYYLFFEGMVYFDGPVFWKGDAFQKVSSVDCLALLRELRVHDPIPGDDLLDKFQLYTAAIQDVPRQVRLLAIRASIAPVPSGRF